LKKFDFEAGEVLLVNKPLGWSSFQLVKKVRYMAKVKKVGHAGTLDPLATGLLILCTGKATKQIESFMGQEKTYTGCFRLGESTPSYDRETEVDERFPTDHISMEALQEVKKSLTGVIAQFPPAHSAIKLDGKRLYESARQGITVYPKSRTVQVLDFDFTSVEMPDIYFSIRCSKGTYIRSLVHDFGRALANGAVLTELCRTAIGGFQLQDAWELATLETAIKAQKTTASDSPQE